MARESDQSIAARTGRPAPSAATTPCICPDRPMAATVASVCATAARTASTVAESHSSGSVSDHPGCAAVTVYSATAWPITVPSRPVTSAFTELVPRSMPRSAEPRVAPSDE